MSQVPSQASRSARRADDRHAHCPICKANDVSGSHVDLCEETEQYRILALANGRASGIPDVTTLDLWAHARSRSSNPLTAARVVASVIDLGWRPVVGSDPKRLWAPINSPAPSVCICHGEDRPHQVHQGCDKGCQPDWHRDDCAIYLPITSPAPTTGEEPR